MAAKSEYARAHERQQNRDIYNWYKSRGICPRCKVKHGAPGGVYCEDCLAVKRKEMQKYFGDYNAGKCKERRERLKAEGLCVCCGKPAVKDRVLCASCARKNSEAQQVRKMKKRLEREAQEERMKCKPGNR